MAGDLLAHCHACGLAQRNRPLPAGAVARCARCGSLLHRNRPDSLDRTLALTLAGMVLFVLANSFPFLTFQMQGQITRTTLATGVQTLYAEGMWELATVVLFTSILAPGIQLALLLMVLTPLKLGWRPRGLRWLFRSVGQLTPWGMMDVFLLGILVSVVKLADMATIFPGTSLFAFGILIFVLAAAQYALDPEMVWSRLPLPPGLRQQPRPGEPVWSCAVCHLALPRASLPWRAGHRHCPRCGSRVHPRKPHSLQRTWALLLAAVLCYVPANVLPIMRVTSFGQTQSDTILSGVRFLLEHDLWPLALVVFVASLFVPLLKLLILIVLLLSVQWHATWRRRERTRLYRITETVGRWSMVDIYVVTILVALVRLGNLATIEAQPGAVFFAAVVILTMFAAMSFDPRLIWDTGDCHDGTDPAPP